MNLKSKIFYNHIVLEIFILILNSLINNCSSNSNIIKKRDVKSASFNPIGYQNYLNIINSNKKNKSLDHSNHINKTRKSLTTTSMRKSKKKKNSQLKEKCNKAEKELDLCGAQLLSFGINEATFPNNIEQFDSEYCPNIKKLVNCIRNNTDCYHPFEKQVIR